MLVVLSSLSSGCWCWYGLPLMMETLPRLLIGGDVYGLTGNDSFVEEGSLLLLSLYVLLACALSLSHSLFICFSHALALFLSSLLALFCLSRSLSLSAFSPLYVYLSVSQTSSHQIVEEGRKSNNRLPLRPLSLKPLPNRSSRRRASPHPRSRFRALSLRARTVAFLSAYVSLFLKPSSSLCFTLKPGVK